MAKISLQEIGKPVQPAMEAFNERFRSTLKTDSALLDRIIRYILKRKGKQMRPMFVFLTSLLNGQITESSYNAAALIELLHTASLVHDDVVDESDQRRGLFSVNALWKNKAAVLVGDYLLSRGLLLSLENNEFEMLRIVSTAVKEMSEGELLQIEKTRFMNISEEVYLKIISKKTASLIAACCCCGAQAAGASAENVQRMYNFGLLVGIAFQIKDDLFDFEIAGQTGKPGGLNLHDQKMSLPVIHLLNHSSLLERRHLINLIKNHHDEADKVNEVLEKVRNSQGLQYAGSRMMHYRDQALTILKTFPDHAARTSLEQLVLFTTDRTY
jgi:octaprenyl-diphosphate synthase